MQDYANALQEEFERIANPKKATKMEAYMRNKFKFFGINSPERNAAQRPFLVTQSLPKKNKLEQVIKKLWQKPQREFQYFAQTLVSKYKTKFQEKDIDLFEFMIINKSWWDTIDFIAPNIIGHYFKVFPKKRDEIINKWLKSNDIWLQRSCIIFQLKYKKDTDVEFLAYVINNLLETKEFFINKAIGWALREYGKTNPDWVISFCKKTNLSNLSKREALRIILK